MSSGVAIFGTNVPTSSPAPQWNTISILGDGDAVSFQPWNVPPNASVASLQTGGFWTFQVVFQFQLSRQAAGMINYYSTPTSLAVAFAPFAISPS
jgi:hypothetical protein